MSAARLRLLLLSKHAAEAPIKTFLLILSSLALFWFKPAHAIDPGLAQGAVEIRGTAIPLKHAYVQLQDNAGKVGARPKELRILLADREVPQSVLHGFTFPPFLRMAQEGKLRGLLIELDPDNPKRAVITLLDAPTDPSHALLTRKVSNGENVVRNLKIANNRVSGALESSDSGASTRDLPKVAYSVKFSAPLFTAPR